MVIDDTIIKKYELKKFWILEGFNVIADIQITPNKANEIEELIKAKIKEDNHEIYKKIFLILAEGLEKYYINHFKLNFSNEINTIKSSCEDIQKSLKKLYTARPLLFKRFLKWFYNFNSEFEYMIFNDNLFSEIKKYRQHNVSRVLEGILSETGSKVAIFLKNYDTQKHKQSHLAIKIIEIVFGKKINKRTLQEYYSKPYLPANLVKIAIKPISVKVEVDKTKIKDKRKITGVSVKLIPQKDSH